MRLRTLFAIILTLLVMPVLARAQREGLPVTPVKSPQAETLVQIADVQLEAAFDKKTAPGSKEGLLDSARKGYQKALKQEPKNKAALLGMAHYYARIGEREKAVEMYKKYLTIYPKDANAAHEVALEHARWHDFAGAVAWCEFTMKIDPENRTVKKTLGFCQAFAGQWDEAFATLSQIMPEAQARHNLAGILDQMGHTDACKVQLQLALKADPNFTSAKAFLTELNQPLTPIVAPARGATSKPEVAPPPHTVPAQVTKVYCVEELVVPPFSLTGAIGRGEPVGGSTPEKANATYQQNVEELLKLVVGTVRPYTWDQHGGRGRVEFFDSGCALVVTNTPDVLNEVTDLLESLRRLQEINVSFEVRILRMPVGFAGRTGLGLNGDVIQPEAQLGRFLEEIQKHRDVSIMQSPKVTAFNGQVATVTTCEKHNFVTGGELKKVQGQTVFVPNVKTIELGDVLTISGRASPDGKSVNVEVDVTRTTLSGPVEQFPLTTRITPVFEGGSQGTPIPFTQFLQLPDVKTQRVRKAGLIPTGATLIVGGWKETEELKNDQGIRGKRLFKKEKPPAEFEVVVLATVRVLATEKPEGAKPAQQLEIKPKIYQLKRTAASVAAAKVLTYVQREKLHAQVAADPNANCVWIFADAELEKRIFEMLAALDK